MFSFSKLFLLLGMGAAIYFWLQHHRFRERALQVAITQCRQADIQHLDQNVVLKRMGPYRHANGRWTLRRVFHFEFTSTGERRYGGTVTFDGASLVGVELEAHRVPQLH